MDNFLTSIEITIPQTLYDRLALRAEEIGMTTEQLVGIWLWKVEYEKRTNGDGRSTSRSDASRDDGDLSTGEDD